ncbi:DNA polymerase III subunit delta' [Actinomycetaceae bacterium WB03_NA08]|uniref:DNA polymerase III subunit delta n=1 Tax=Scrofimicrobium canadense TaxID=2652290 RepID=A0A6N7W425_9ACTO|nr:DNA polymerase III subunit delta' [Scrofimicrobium canadense]MSS83202.1 DNA polymerase III subunit delta' [Scrofimicrobium canadense]
MSVWDVLVGQEEATQVLRSAASHGGESHAWLITGPPGSGRSVAARCFAAALQCTGPEPGCGECEGCRTTMSGTNLDVTIVATDKVIIDTEQVKDIRTQAYASPIMGGYRVIIIEDADRINDQTGNRLLKAIEEPPEKTIWVLCAPTPQDMLVTIRSRCRVLNLVTPDAGAVAQLLQATEGVPYDKALVAAQISQSHIGLARAMVKDPHTRDSRVELMRLALNPSNTGEAVIAAGKLMAAAKDVAEKTSADLDQEEVSSLLSAYGLTEDEVLPRDVATQLRNLQADQKRRSRRALTDALDRVCLDLLSFFRDVMVRSVGADVPVVNADMEEELSGWLGRNAGIAADAVDLARRRLGSNAAQLLVMEALLVSIMRTPKG